MTAWRGMMDWPMDTNSICRTCGTRFREHGLVGLVLGTKLTWGFIHGVCRCSVCHTQYTMRDPHGRHVAVPICRLKEEYKAPAKVGWALLGTPVDTWTEQQWKEARDATGSICTNG